MVKKEQFWLPTSTAVPLLSWDSEVSRGQPGGSKMVLKGATFSDDAASEWFKSFSLEVDGEVVLALSALGTMRILIDGYEPPAHFKGQYVQGSSKVWVQARALPLRKVGGLAAEEVFIRTPSMVLAISSDEARKFDGSSLTSGGGLFADDETRRAEFAHLRVKIVGGLPETAEGLLAELSGARHKSDATLQARMTPPEVQAQREAKAEVREELLRSGATGATVRAAGAVDESSARELVDTVRYHLRDTMSPHFLGALFHSDEKDGTLLRATNAMRATPCRRTSSAPSSTATRRTARCSAR